MLDKEVSLKVHAALMIVMSVAGFWLFGVFVGFEFGIAKTERDLNMARKELERMGHSVESERNRYNQCNRTIMSNCNASAAREL